MLKVKIVLSLMFMTLTTVALASPQCPSAIEATRSMTLSRVIEDGVEVTDTGAYDAYELELRGSASQFTLQVSTQGQLIIREIYNAQ